MNRTLPALFVALAATAAVATGTQAQQSDRRQKSPAETMPFDRHEQQQPDNRLQRDGRPRARGADTYILHDRASRRGGSVDSGYGLDLMMAPRRSAPGDRR
jgi:hypothetical protein